MSDEQKLTWQRVDTSTGTVETVQIPASMFWTAPMTRQQIARRLGVHRDTLATWIDQGEIEVRGVGTLFQARPWDLGPGALAEAAFSTAPKYAEDCGIGPLKSTITEATGE